MVSHFVESLRAAVKNRTPRPQLTIEAPDLTIEQAYEIQMAGMELALHGSDSLCGYKMGLTSRAKQRDVNVFAPIRGYLLASMEREKGADISVDQWIHPRIEPEIAVVLKTAVGEGATLREVIRALEFVGPAVEILDSRYENFRFTLPDVIADNTSAAGFIIGSTNYLDRLNEIGRFGVTLRKNSWIERTGAPAAVLGDPLLSVVSLAQGLGKMGRKIEPGMVVLTGGISASISFGKGDLVECQWPGETLSFRAV